MKMTTEIWKKVYFHKSQKKSTPSIEPTSIECVVFPGMAGAVKSVLN